jgi:hypothetical protein
MESDFFAQPTAMAKAFTREKAGVSELTEV